MALPLSRVNLRPLTAEDLPHLLRWDADHDIRQALGGSRFEHDPPHVWLRRFRHGRGLAFAITGPDGDLLGDLQLQDINWHRREAELRICLGKKRDWGHGLGTEAVAMALSIAFFRLRLRQVYLRVYASNRRAIRCYVKCGFRKVGRLPPRADATEGTLLLMEATAGTHSKRRVHDLSGPNPH